jgi:hypothetical protein
VLPACRCLILPLEFGTKQVQSRRSCVNLAICVIEHQHAIFSNNLLFRLVTATTDARAPLHGSHC